tara:strand:+ start:589 stop:1194 length:606 start_codon:yes stop_codon:yes gene_type:complete
MKILFFVDLHESKKALEQLKKKAKKADLIVCAGDFSIFENKIKWVLREIDRMGKEVLLIPGNHETLGITRNICSASKRLKDIHGQVFKKGELLFVAYGEGGFSDTDPGFEKFWAKKKQVILDLQKKGLKLIFVTHGPPYGTTVDDMGQKDYVGCKSYTKFIKRHKPLLSVSGHLHENAGKEAWIGKTLVFNPGPKGVFKEV